MFGHSVLDQEDEKLLQLRGQQNKSFAKIAEQIEGRSYNDVKNRWSQISRQIAALKVGRTRKVKSILHVQHRSPCETRAVRLCHVKHHNRKYANTKWIRKVKAVGWVLGRQSPRLRLAPLRCRWYLCFGVERLLKCLYDASFFRNRVFPRK